MLRKGDHDTDSAYSGDGSNTDSGRGPSEEGEGRFDAHHRPVGKLMPEIKHRRVFDYTFIG